MGTPGYILKADYHRSSLVAQRVKTWHCYCSGSGCWCGMGSDSGLGTSTCHRHGQKKKKKKKQIITVHPLRILHIFTMQITFIYQVSRYLICLKYPLKACLFTQISSSYGLGSCHTSLTTAPQSVDLWKYTVICSWHHQHTVVGQG